MSLQKPRPVIVVELFPEILTDLVQLLRSLSPGDWQRPTACGDWTVKDVALHLLGGEVGNLSWRRDGHGWAVAPGSWDELVMILNDKNQAWVETTRRLSTRVLVDLLEFTGAQMNAFFRSLDLETAGGPVSWAGPESAPVWLDVAREYTERWHHQQHIRDAVEKPGLMAPRYLKPVLATFVHALPQAYRNIDAPEGTIVTLSLTGAEGGLWSIRREGKTWQLYTGAPEHPEVEVVISAMQAWRLFTRGLDETAARQAVSIYGDRRLGKHVLGIVSIIA